MDSPTGLTYFKNSIKNLFRQLNSFPPPMNIKFVSLPLQMGEGEGGGGEDGSPPHLNPLPLRGEED
jgi:hypothetical protein